MGKVKPKGKAGRKPQPLSDAVKATICRQVALGKSLRKVLQAKGMPSRSKVHEELELDAQFADRYARARRQNIEVHIDAIVELADKATGKNANAVRLKVDVRKWLASKLVPKVYGERLEIESPFVPDLSDASSASKLERARRLAFAFAEGIREQDRQERIKRGALLPAPAATQPAAPAQPAARDESRIEREIEINPRPPKPPAFRGDPEEQGR